MSESQPIYSIIESKKARGYKTAFTTTYNECREDSTMSARK